MTTCIAHISVVNKSLKTEKMTQMTVTCTLLKPWPESGHDCPIVFPIARYRGTSLIRNSPLLGPYSRNIPRVIWWSLGEGGCLL